MKEILHENIYEYWGKDQHFSLPLVIQSPLWFFFLLDPSTFAAICLQYIAKKQNMKRGLLRMGKLDFNKKNDVL